VCVPEGVDEGDVRGRLRDEYGIDIGAGLGPLKGRVWRIGLMGHGSQKANVILLLAALVDLLEAAHGGNASRHRGHSPGTTVAG
jgi:alanine-glyoxylate transaminase/serine-glyoxylate transaminase/serine-pyruvate transaminase